MPGRKATPSRPAPRAAQRSARSPRSTSAVERGALVVVDQRRLQSAAWAKVHTARKRVEKAARDLHRHEAIDTPAYESWLHRTFPLLVTTLRDLHAEAAAKAQKIEAVQAMAFTTGRSVKRIWREQKEREQNPDRFDAGHSSEERHRDRTSANDERGAPFESKPPPPRSRTAREIYRRLVQRLHPDRGGDWTAADQRLWHQVQQAWAAGDTDWLARLEVDWETANEVLGPNSPLSRLYRAIEELDAARRDTERKLHEYRNSPAWRFSLTEKKRSVLHARIRAELNAEIGSLRRHIRPLDALIAALEEDWTRAGNRAKARRHRPDY
jgi:hypothetical protein